MKPRRFLSFPRLLLNALFACATTQCLATGRSSLRLDPHTYGGARGGEPMTQLIGLAKTNFENISNNQESNVDPWQFALHLEGEALGRRDISVDIDRAWYQFKLASHSQASALTFGRIHPWDISLHPDRNRPWGYLGTLQPQNRGVQLGYGFSDTDNIPAPYLLGWLGAHYWSDRSHTETIQWGASASPIFVPNMGSEVSFSVKDPASVSRFGRRPPATVEIDGREYPIHYEIDRSRIIEDVVLQPQLMAQIAIRSAVQNPFWESWLTVARSPSPDPSVDSNSFLKIKPDGIEAQIKVKPRFRERTTGQWAHHWNLVKTPLNPALFTNVNVSDEKRGGYEVGIDSVPPVSKRECVNRIS